MIIKKNYLLGDKKISIIITILFSLFGICLIMPLFHRIIIYYGELFIHRTLNHEIWFTNFICWGKFFIFCGIISALGCFFENKNFILILLSFAFCVVMLSFIFEPLTGDLKVFLAAAKQADYLDGNFIYNVFNSWELKGVGGRMTTFILYKAASFFSLFPLIEFEYYTSAIYLFFSSILVLASIYLFFPEKQGKTKLYLFLCLECILFSTQIMCRIQVEMTCTIFLLLAFSFYVNSIKTNKNGVLKLCFAGALVAVTFYYKSIFILMAVSFFCACCLYNEQIGEKGILKKCFYMIIGGTIVLTAGIIMILLVNPYELQDMKNASLFQTTLFSDGHFNIFKFFSGFKKALIGIPVLLFSSLFTIKSTIRQLKKRHFEYVFLLLFLWAIPSIIVILANNFFIYHFYIFIFPAVVFLFINLDEFKNKYRCIVDGHTIRLLIICLIILLVIIQYKTYSGVLQKFWFFIITFIFVVSIILTTFNKDNQFNFVIVHILPVLISLLIFVEYISIFSQNAYFYRQNDILAYKNNQLSEHLWQDAETVLYLDDGAGGYVIGKKSYLRYFYPLPLQRARYNPKITYSDFYKSQEKLVLSYKGKYIFANENWFFGKDNNTHIYKKLLEEYFLIGNYFSYAPTYDLFKKQKIIGVFSVYKRK